MLRSVKIASTATFFIGISLHLWRIAFTATDLAILVLFPMGLAIWLGFWSLTLQPWKAHLDIALRQDSTWKKIFSGTIRTVVLNISFTFVAVFLMAWQTLRASTYESILLVIVVFLSILLYYQLLNRLSRHVQQPFARSFATVLATWTAAIPALLAFTFTLRNYATIPGEMLDASFEQALLIGIKQLPQRGGWVSSLLSIPYGYEAAKLWVVIRLSDYPIIGWLFSLDAALFSFILCRTSIVVSQFIETYIIQEMRTYKDDCCNSEARL